MWTTGVPGVWPIPKSTAAPGGGWAQRQVASDSLRGHWYVGEGGRDAGPVPGRSSTLKTPNKKPGAKKGWIVWGLRKYMFYKCCFTSVGPGDTKAQFWIYKVWLWDTSGAMFIKQTILKHKNLIFWNCGESHEIFRDPACFFWYVISRRLTPCEEAQGAEQWCQNRWKFSRWSCTLYWKIVWEGVNIK